MRVKWDIPKEVEFRRTGEDWLQNLLLPQSASIRSNILMIQWKTWSLRNNTIHGDGKDTVTGAVHQLLRLGEDLLAAEQAANMPDSKQAITLFDQSTTKPVPLKNNRWIAPAVGYVKINCDAAFLKELGDTWGGAVARDHRGFVHLSVGCRLNQCTSVEEAEAAAVLMGMSERLNVYGGPIILEVDCAAVGRNLLSEDPCKSSSYAIIADIKKTSNAFQRFEVRVIN
ncbi:uncharacterized protein [Aegilops tauschii subsp. strangulata]|uniref:uncharacterized protein n=1 Tax=Aegilops tauschii subsp. strangulata TaxID=200361 RepID=UPI003CC8B0B7